MEKMSKVNKMIETIELVHKDCVCLFKMGTFYHVYGKDSYIISFLFHYKIDMLKYEAGFPINSLNRVLAKLEDEKINYVTLDNRNNYEVDEKQDYKNLNRYDKVYNKAREYVNMKNRIEKINLRLTNGITKKGIRKIIGSVEQVLDESGEV